MTDLMASRRALLLGGAGLATALAMPHVARAAGGSITVMGFFGIFEDNYTKAVIEPFMRANPEIKVGFRPVRGSAEATAMLRTQRSRPSNDVVIMDIAIAAQNNRDGLFAPLDPAKVPNLANIPAWGRPANNMGAAVTQDQLAILCNPTKLKKPLASWMDLADPALSGRLALPLGDVRGTVLLALLDRAAGADYKKDVGPGLAAMKRIAANAQTFEPQPDVYTAIRSGLVDGGVGWNARAQLNVDQAKGEFAAITPAEGTGPQINTVNLVANTPNAEAAQRFIDYALGEDAQKAFAQALYYGPTNSKVSLDPALSARIFGSEAARAKQMELDWDWFAQNNNVLIQRIRREVIAG